jgi:hypothetical protein
MFKFVNAGAKEALLKVAKYAAAGGLLLLAVVLTLVEPDRAQAGITNDVTVVNNTDDYIYISVDGFGAYPIPPGDPPSSMLTIHVGDPNEGITTLVAKDGDGNVLKKEVFGPGEPGPRVNNFTWEVP